MATHERTCGKPPLLRAHLCHGTEGRTSAASRLAWLRRWVSPVVIVLAWQVLSSVGVIPEDKLASPAQIGARAWELAVDGTLGSATLTSVQRVLLGFVVGASIGLVLAVVAGLSRIGEDAFDPPMQMLRTLPHFGLIPLFIVWIGIGEAPKIALIAMGVAFPLYLNTFAGIRSIDRKMTRGRGDDGADPPPAAATRRAARSAAAGAGRSPAEPRHRLALADRRRDRQRRLRPRLHDQPRP